MSSGYFARRVEVRRLVQHAFDRRAVLALPRDDFERARGEARGLRVHVGELRRDAPSSRARRTPPAPSGHPMPRNAILEPSRESVKLEPTDASAGASRVIVLRLGIQAEQVREGPLRRREEKPARLPGDDRRVLVERGRQDRRRAAGRGDRRDQRVRIVERRVRHRRLEGDAGAVGRPDRVASRGRPA